MSVSKWAGKLIHRNASDGPTDAHRLLDAMAESGCSIISFDKEGSIHYCAPSLKALLPHLPKDRDDFVDTVTQDESMRLQVLQLTETCETKNPLRLQLNINGTHVSLTGIAVPGSPPLKMVTIQEIQDGQECKAQLERLERLATVGQIAAGAVHEFNNNLTSILGWAQIAEQNLSTDSPAASAVAIIAENARKAKRIFSKLLNMSRTKPEEADEEAASPTKVADDALGIMFFEMKTRNIVLTRSYGEVGLCDIDEDRLGQVFINIIKNAVEAMDRDGELIVSAFEDHGSIHIAFKDNGPGMPAQTASRVFESFFTTKQKDESALGGGTGLGLSISLDIVRQYGGDIELTTELGVGSCFTVVLPRREDKERTERPSAASRPTIPPGAVVLVVDDEPDIGEMIRMSLELKGVSVLSVQNGEDAVIQLQKMHFDAAFVDYSMPGLSGHELGRKIKAVDTELPVVFMSGLAVEKDDIVGDFIKKPFDLDDIQAKLYDVLKQKKESAYKS